MQKINKQPTFLLRVNPNEIYNRFKNGEYLRPIPIKAKLIVSKPQIKPSSLYKESVITDFCRTNEKEVEIFMLNGCQNLKGGRCDYCKEDFVEERVGYPVAYEHKAILKDDVYKNIHLFWVDGCFCSYSCCLSYVKLIKPSLLKDSNMLDVENLLKFMARLNGVTIKRANCPQFVDWKNENVVYKKTSTVVKIPAQTVYAKIIG